MDKEEIIKHYYNEIPKKDIGYLFLNLYNYNSNKNTPMNKFKKILAYFHETINCNFEELNNCLEKTKHFKAYNSKELKNTIKLIFELRNELEKSDYSFKIIDLYNGYFNNLEPILKDSYGTDFDDNFKKISIEKYERIFMFKDEDIEIVDISNDLNEIIKIISVRKIEFEKMSCDEKLEN